MPNPRSMQNFLTFNQNVLRIIFNQKKLISGDIRINNKTKARTKGSQSGVGYGPLKNRSVV